MGFQRGMGLVPDGIVGPDTMDKLQDDPIRITHFRDVEFYCHCLGRYCKGLPAGGIDLALKILLERIRSAAGDYARHRHQRIPLRGMEPQVRRALLSQHLYGRAADIIIRGMPAEDVNVICDELNPYGGVGLGGENITHVDVRGKRARWRY